MAGIENTVATRRLKHTERSQLLRSLFVTRFLQEPAFYIRVPGRVNLIGEHIDYCGYGVCPMALEQDIMMAVSSDEASQLLQIMNTDSAFPEYSCNIKSVSISNTGDSPPAWHQYFLCGVKGILDVLPEDTHIKGFNVVVSGTIPQSAGLSSSSALVSAAALATAYAHNYAISKEKIANLCAECEHYIGTQGGGMDQAIAFLATEGCAKFIEFSPLRSRDLTLPKGAVFVIAHSLVQINKAATADFNCRVVECRLAAQILAKSQGLQWQDFRRLGDVQRCLGIDLNSMISLVCKILHEESYKVHEILQELNTTFENLEEVSLTLNTRRIQEFKLQQRALHVFQEALRVQKFYETCENSSSSGEAVLKILGKLMMESHESLRDLYECSHPTLDKLVQLSQPLTLGTRLTGAGWGGCVVALVRPQNVNKYIEMLKSKFYSELGITNHFESLVFATQPKEGACVYLV